MHAGRERDEEIIQTCIRIVIKAKEVVPKEKKPKRRKMDHRRNIRVNERGEQVANYKKWQIIQNIKY